MNTNKISTNEITATTRANKFQCYYHPSKTGAATVLCQHCDKYFCQEDAQFSKISSDTHYVCPICYLRRETVQFFVVSPVCIFGAIFFFFGSIGIPFAAYEQFKEYNAFNFVVLIFFMFIFWIGTIMLPYTPFFAYKQMIQTEFEIAPFIRSIEDIQDKKILEYKKNLEKKYDNRDSRFRRIIV